MGQSWVQIPALLRKAALSAVTTLSARGGVGVGPGQVRARASHLPNECLPAGRPGHAGGRRPPCSKRAAPPGRGRSPLPERGSVGGGGSEASLTPLPLTPRIVLLVCSEEVTSWPELSVRTQLAPAPLSVDRSRAGSPGHSGCLPAPPSVSSPPQALAQLSLILGTPLNFS